MATNPIGSGKDPVTLPGVIPPMPAVARILARHPRERLEAFVSIAIDLMDVADGDSDIEPNGDDLDGTGAEDDFCEHSSDGSPGCPVADRGEHAWIEWHTMRGSQKRGPNIARTHEDVEDDDPAEEDDHSGDIANEDEPEGFAQFRGELGAGCPISDPGGCQYD